MGYDALIIFVNFDFLIGGLGPNLVSEGSKKSASTLAETSFTIPKHSASAIALLGNASATEKPPERDFFMAR